MDESTAAKARNRVVVSDGKTGSSVKRNPPVPYALLESGTWNRGAPRDVGESMVGRIALSLGNAFKVHPACLWAVCHRDFGQFPSALAEMRQQPGRSQWNIGVRLIAGVRRFIIDLLRGQ